MRNQSFNSLPVGMFAGLGTSDNEVKLYIDGFSTSYLGGCGLYGCSLYLANMNLTELPAGVFDGLEHLNGDLFLSLQGNKLRTLPEGLFRNLSGLRYLYLENNRLEELPSSACARNHVDLLVCFYW